MTFINVNALRSSFCSFKCNIKHQVGLGESSKNQCDPDSPGRASGTHAMASAKSFTSPQNPHSSKSTYLTEHLRFAAASGNAQEVARLLGEGVKNLPDETGCNALHLAASSGHANVVAALLLSACDVNAVDLAGCTALQRAAAQGHVTVVKQLLKHGADVNHQDNVHGNSALHEASWKGYSQTVAALCKCRAQLQLKNRGGFAALHLCCQNGHNQSCRELLFAGCNPDVQNNYGDTSLHTSARYGHAGVTRILISAQCSVSDQNKNGDTALHIAAAMGRKKLTRILLEAGCDKSLRNKQNETARDIATRKDLKEILAILNTPPVVLKAQSENKKKEAAAGKSSKGGRRFDEVDKGHDRERNERKREKNGSGTSSKESNCHRKDKKHKNTHKVHFEKSCVRGRGKQWSPYGCHYYPDPEAFPAPNLDSLPDEPLQKGEQYFLDLAGNICKGPVGVGYTCYCAPFFRNVEARLERDKQELKEHIDRAHERLDRKVTSLEQRLSHTVEKERGQCEARSLRLAEWLCRELSGLEEPAGISERPSSHEDCRRRSILSDRRRTKSLEMLPNDEEVGHVGESQGYPCGARLGSGEVGPSAQWNSDKESYPEVLPNPCDLVLPNWRLERVRRGRRNSDDSLDRVSETVWGRGRSEQLDGDGEGAPSVDGLEEEGSRSSESSDGEDEMGPEERRLGVVEEGSAQAGPDYENVVSCERPLWKSGSEKCILSELPYRSRTTVYENAAVSTVVTSAECHKVESDSHNDSGYSTKVFGSSKGPSPSLSGSVEMEASTHHVSANPFPSKVAASESQFKKAQGFISAAMKECHDLVKTRANLKPVHKVNGNVASGSMV
ncbi:ankyrin repeat domain-containing protein 6 [Ischnura elegans]|uniref:ankyrin repeat domain-containing protein 6 n=1 Tax=Ischnura elegans TaxID=197161 RepID=UPI001ED89B95|nr:ankyrin repeat domain-containing protein 6 [Ischnura elegans]